MDRRPKPYQPYPTTPTSSHSSSFSGSRSKSTESGATCKAQAYARGYIARKNYKRLLKKKAHRDRVVREILSTEQSYVKSIQSMITLYYLPLKDDPKKYGLTKEDLVAIFGNIETVLNLHQELSKKLEDKLSQWSNSQTIGDVFKQMAPFLKMLNTYCSNFDSALNTINFLKKEQKAFASFLEKTELTEGILTLSGYLIQPVQRVPRYNLLLEELIKSTWEFHRDYDTLCNALREMKKIAVHINESMHKSDKASRVVQIQSDLGGEVMLVEPHRRFVRDGSVFRVRRQGRKSSPMSTGSLWLYLFNDLIIFAGQLLLSYRFLEKYTLNSTQIMDVPGTDKHPFLFHVNCVDAQSGYLLAVETEEQKTEWMLAIAAAIQQQASNISNRDIKVEQRKTIDREGFADKLSDRSKSTTPNKIDKDRKSGTSPRFRFAFDLANMPVTESEDKDLVEEDSLSFSERRRLFERGLIQPNRVTPPTTPVKVGKINIDLVQSMQKRTSTTDVKQISPPPEIQRGIASNQKKLYEDLEKAKIENTTRGRSPSFANRSSSQLRRSASYSPNSAILADEVKSGAVNNLRQKYESNSSHANEMTSPLLGGDGSSKSKSSCCTAR
eukprot:TRINITY_DN2731_c1_g1_i2.p1 TRINITY_DN2731_c1_g1~~TRINITY_DN2731_c1_g1_i2.p1  ORF type:complete len:611 (-),score=114.69 TRINITY_DN2731_c1_g1_i2:15-1847(-)